MWHEIYWTIFYHSEKDVTSNDNTITLKKKKKKKEKENKTRDKFIFTRFVILKKKEKKNNYKTLSSQLNTHFSRVKYGSTKSLLIFLLCHSTVIGRNYDMCNECIISSFETVQIKRHCIAQIRYIIHSKLCDVWNSLTFAPRCHVTIQYAKPAI